MSWSNRKLDGWYIHDGDSTATVILCKPCAQRRIKEHGRRNVEAARNASTRRAALERSAKCDDCDDQRYQR